MTSNNQPSLIPNVSTVFRELVQMNQFNPRLNSTSSNNFTVNTFNYPNSYDKKPEKVDFISDMGLDDRQKRHQQLMSKFKNSFQQNRQLFGINQQFKDFQNGNNIRNEGLGRRYTQRNSFNTSTNNNFNYQNNTNYIYSFQNQPQRQTQFGFNHQFSRTNSNKWTAPKLKYRHIEDFAQKKSEKQITEPIKIQQNQDESRLKQDFYGTGFSKRSINQSNQKINRNKAFAEDQNIQTESEQSFNKISKLSQQPSKYNEKLESYYEICKKPIKQLSNSVRQPENESKKNSEKFIRKAVPKVEGYNIQKALKILSIE